MSYSTQAHAKEQTSRSSARALPPGMVTSTFSASATTRISLNKIAASRLYRLWAQRRVRMRDERQHPRVSVSQQSEAADRHAVCARVRSVALASGAHRSGCMVTSATSSGSESSCKKFLPFVRLYSSYSGKWRPAWRKSLRCKRSAARRARVRRSGAGALSAGLCVAQALQRHAAALSGAWHVQALRRRVGESRRLALARWQGRRPLPAGRSAAAYARTTRASAPRAARARRAA